MLLLLLLLLLGGGYTVILLYSDFNWYMPLIVLVIQIYKKSCVYHKKVCVMWAYTACKLSLGALSGIWGKSGHYFTFSCLSSDELEGPAISCVILHPSTSCKPTSVVLALQMEVLYWSTQSQPRQEKCILYIPRMQDVGKGGVSNLLGLHAKGGRSRGVVPMLKSTSWAKKGGGTDPTDPSPRGGPMNSAGGGGAPGSEFFKGG